MILPIQKINSTFHHKALSFVALKSLVVLSVVSLLFATSGCSLLVMGFKMIKGDPVVTAPFKLRTNVDLTKTNKKVLVLCTIPEHLRTQFPSLDHDITERVNRKLKLHNVQLVSSREVNQWYNRIGGVWDNIQEVATEFETDYIIHYEVSAASIRESSSSNMFRGNYSGHATGYEVRTDDEDGPRVAYSIFEHEFRSKYPRHAPVPADQTKERIFREEFMTRISDELARVLYDHPMGDDIF